MDLLLLAVVFALPFVALAVIGIYSVGGIKKSKRHRAGDALPSIESGALPYYITLAEQMQEGVVVLNADLSCAYPLSDVTASYVEDFERFYQIFFDAMVGISGSRALMETVFKQTSREAIDRLLSYFPVTLRIDERELQLRYHYAISQKHLYIFLIDRSDQSKQEQMLEENLRVQDMVIRVLKYRSEYSRLMREMNERAITVLNRIYNVSNDIGEFKQQFVTELVRIRNDLRLFNMSKSVENIQTMEQSVQALPDDLPVSEARHLLPASDWFSMTASDREDMASYLSDGFLSGNSILVNKEWLSQLELIVDSIPDAAHRKQIDDIILKIKMTEIQEITRDFDRILQKKAEALGKKLNPIQLSYGFLTYDREFIHSVMMDIFGLLDGSVQFGIEHLATRFRRNKPEFGTIHINLRQENEELVIEYADDGVGVEPSRFAHVCESFRVREGGIVTGTFVPTIKSLSSPLQALNRKVRSQSGTLSFESVYGQYIVFIVRIPYRSYLERMEQ